MTFHDFSPADDNFHAPPDADPWFTETCWFSFNIPERKLGCWLYAWVRPNMNNAGGGVVVWDSSATAAWDSPYYKWQFCQPIPVERDLRDFHFPENYAVRMIEPLMRYQLTYRDRDLIAIDCTFDGLFPPHGFKSGEPPFHAAPHLDQMGHVTGELVLHGERLPIDCYAMRDRSWGPRLDHRGNRIGYPFGCAPDLGFCLFAIPNRNFSDANERVNHGFLWRDGLKTQLTGGLRNVERDPVHNWPVRMEIDAIDENGRSLQAIGEVESRVLMPRPRGLCINSSVRWMVDGREAYGEDQDVWRYEQWQAARRQKGQLAR